MKRDKVGIGKELFEFLNELYLQAACTRRGKIRIISKYAHPEGDRAAAQFAANSTHADNTKRLVVELNALKICASPTAATHACIGLRNLSGNAEQKRKRVFGGGNGIAAGRIQHHNPPPSSGFDVN